MSFLTSTANSNGATVSINLPVGAAAGDFGILIFETVNNVAFTLTPAWTKVLDNYNGTNIPVRIFTRTLSPADITAGAVTLNQISSPGSPILLVMVIVQGGAALRNIGGASTGNFVFTVTGTTGTGELIPPGPYADPPQPGDLLLYVGGCLVEPVALSAGSLLVALISSFPNFFGGFPQLLLNGGGTAGSPGNVSVTGTISSNNGVAAEVIAIYFPVSISCDSPPAGQVGTAYTHTFPATGNAPLAFAITSGSLPPGLNLDTSTGVVSGTPTLAGTYPFAVQVTDATTSTADVDCSIVIDPAPIVAGGVDGTFTAFFDAGQVGGGTK